MENNEDQGQFNLPPTGKWEAISFPHRGFWPCQNPLEPETKGPDPRGPRIPEIEEELDIAGFEWEKPDFQGISDEEFEKMSGGEENV